MTIWGYGGITTSAPMRPVGPPIQDISKSRLPTFTSPFGHMWSKGPWPRLLPNDSVRPGRARMVAEGCDHPPARNLRVRLRPAPCIPGGIMTTSALPRAHNTRRGLAAAFVLVLSAGLLSSTAAFASHPEVSLTGSNFEIDTDANLRVDDAGSPGLGQRRRDAEAGRRQRHERQLVRPRHQGGHGRPDCGLGQHSSEQERLEVLRCLPGGHQQHRFPPPLLVASAGSDRHDQHGLRVQPEQTCCLPQRRDPGPDRR